jgi:hypothetical protein
MIEDNQQENLNNDAIIASQTSDTINLRPKTIEQPKEEIIKPVSIEGANPIQPQNQLPADSYMYSNTSNLGNIINDTAERYSLDPHELEALTNTIRNNKANLTGFWQTQVGFYPGMSAESLVENIARVADLSNTDIENQKQKAILEGKTFTGNGIQQLVDSLESIDKKKSGKAYYDEILDSLREADHVKFDTDVLSEYYETLIKSGHNKADAWMSTMQQQDKYRAAQDQRAVTQDFNNMRDPLAMQKYTEDLYTKIENSTDADSKLRLIGQYEAAAKLTQQYTEAFQKDPATFIMTKNKSFNALLEEANKSRDYAQVVAHLDAEYDRLNIPEVNRTYLPKAQAEQLAKQINSVITENPEKAQQTLASIMTTYKQGSSKIIHQLIRNNQVGPEARILIEAARTGSPVYNGDVLDMMKHKMTLKGNFTKEMFHAPDTSTANTLRTKLERDVYGLPGYKAMVQNLNLAGNIKGKIELAQYYADMGAYYKYKNPSLSNKEITQMVQTNLIDSVYTYDANSRILLQKRTLDGKPIIYNRYSPEQASSYLAERNFTGLGYTVSNKSKDVSNALLNNKANIRYRTLDQFTVQPFYQDEKTGISELIMDKDGKPLKLNLKYLGDEDILGTIKARDGMRDTLQQLYSLNGRITSLDKGGFYITPETFSGTQKILNVEKLMQSAKDTKSLQQELERSQMSKSKIDALINATEKHQEFELELQKYQKLQRLHRDTAHRADHKAAELIGPFFADMLSFSDKQHMMKTLSEQDTRSKIYKTELKKQREVLYAIEKDFLNNAAAFLDHKGEIQDKPFTQFIDTNLYDKLWYGGY